MNKDIKYIDWGIIEYSEALAKQEKMFNDAIALKRNPVTKVICLSMKVR